MANKKTPMRIICKRELGPTPDAETRKKMEREQEQEQKNSLLWSALELSAWERALEALSLGANINAAGRTEKGSRHWSCPLAWAAITGDEERLVWLIEHGALVGDERKHGPPIYGNQALRYAAEHGRLSCVKALLEAGASVGARDQEGATPIHFAARKGTGRLECLGALAQAGANVDEGDNQMQTPLHLAAHAGALEACVELLRLGASAEIKNANGETPMALARNENKKWYGTSMEQRELCAMAIEAHVESLALSSHLPAQTPKAARAPKKAL